MAESLPTFEEDAVANGKRYVIGGVSVRLPKVEDLMIMKAVAHRPRDLQDIEGLLQAHPNLDLSSVRQWVREFASVTAMSDLIDDFEKLLARLNRTP